MPQEAPALRHAAAARLLPPGRRAGSRGGQASRVIVKHVSVIRQPLSGHDCVEGAKSSNQAEAFQPPFAWRGGWEAESRRGPTSVRSTRGHRRVVQRPPSVRETIRKEVQTMATAVHRRVSCQGEALHEDTA